MKAVMKRFWVAALLALAAIPAMAQEDPDQGYSGQIYIDAVTIGASGVAVRPRGPAADGCEGGYFRFYTENPKILELFPDTKFQTEASVGWITALLMREAAHQDLYPNDPPRFAITFERRTGRCYSVVGKGSPDG